MKGSAIAVTMTLSAPALAAPDTAERAAILDVARKPAELALSKPVRFRVRTLRIEGGWAFLLSSMVEPDGRPLSYRGTSLAEAARHGAVSGDYVALLLRRQGGAWRVVAHAVSPSDAVWETWPDEHSAPPALFRTGP